MKLLATTLLAILTVVSTGNQERGQVDMQLGEDFPKATKNTERFVIRLPKLSPKLEELSKVEITVGKTTKTNGRDVYQFEVAAWPQKDTEGKISHYLIVGDVVGLSQMRRPGSKPAIKYIKAKPFSVNYNSRKPLIFYVTKGAEVRYRVYQAQEEKSAKKG